MIFQISWLYHRPFSFLICWPSDEPLYDFTTNTIVTFVAFCRSNHASVINTTTWNLRTDDALYSLKALNVVSMSLSILETVMWTPPLDVTEWESNYTTYHISWTINSYETGFDGRRKIQSYETTVIWIQILSIIFLKANFYFLGLQTILLKILYDLLFLVLQSDFQIA